MFSLKIEVYVWNLWTEMCDRYHTKNASTWLNQNISLVGENSGFPGALWVVTSKFQRYPLIDHMYGQQKKRD